MASVATAAAILGLMHDLDARLSRALSASSGTQVRCSGAWVISPTVLRVTKIQASGDRSGVDLEDVRIAGPLIQYLLPGPDLYRITTGRLTLRSGAWLGSAEAVELGPASALVRLDGDALNARAVRLGGQSRAAGGLDLVSGRVRRAHLSVRLDEMLRARLAPLEAVLGEGLSAERRLRLTLLNGRVRVDGARRPVLDLTWAPG